MSHFRDILNQHAVVWLNSNSSSSPSYLAVGEKSSFKLPSESKTDAFAALKSHWESNKSWLFGYFSYDLKNDVENLTSNNHDALSAPKVHLVEPHSIFIKRDHTWHIEVDELGLGIAFAEWLETDSQNGKHAKTPLQPRVSKSQYLRDLDSILDHIQRGDIYELNYCQEFYNDSADIQPLQVYHRLNKLTNTPLSSYLKLDTLHVLCGSPERFISKKGNTVKSQPIKGTIKRGKTDEEDKSLKRQLALDPKERSENIMITDLVRNDLSHYASKGTVCVEELCEVYSFETVHQLISTVTAKLKENTHWVDVIRKAFPMGSMTGAPKIRSMQLIEDYEHSKRGIYSGAIGYITPDGDFDFNVVIRSLIYNQETKYLSAMVGGAITSKSDPIKEYEECLLKAEALRNALK